MTPSSDDHHGDDRPAHPVSGDIGDPETARPEWHYEQRDARGTKRAYVGYVRYVDGAAGDRLRGELAGVIRDLLDWANTARHCESEETEQDERDAA